MWNSFLRPRIRESNIDQTRCNTTDEKKAGSFEFEGDLAARDATSLHKAVLAALNDGDEIIIDARRVTSLDVSILQILIAAQIAAGKLGRTITLLRVPDGPVETAFAKAGFDISKDFSLPQSALSH